MDQLEAGQCFVFCEGFTTAERAGPHLPLPSRQWEVRLELARTTARLMLSPFPSPQSCLALGTPPGGQWKAWALSGLARPRLSPRVQ